MNEKFTNDKKKQIGLYIRHCRKMKEWTQEFFAEKVGVCCRTIGRIERGHAPLDYERLEDIAEALSVPVSDILNAGQDAA